MNNGLKLLLMAAGAIVTCIVVVVGFQLTKSGKSDTSKATEQYTAMMSDYDEVKLTVYEDSTASGTDVVNYVKDNASALIGSEVSQIIINTKLGSQTFNTGSAVPSPTPASGISTINYTNEQSLKEAIEKYQKYTTAKCYINPKGKFSCSITRNSNGMITVITFTQE